MFQIILTSGHKIITNLPTLTVLTREGLRSCALEDTKGTLIMPPVCHKPDTSYTRAWKTYLTEEQGIKASQTMFKNIHPKSIPHLPSAPDEFKYGFVKDRLSKCNFFSDGARTILYDSTSRRNMELIRAMFNSQGIPTWQINHKKYNRLVARTISCINFAYQNSLNLRIFDEFTKRASFWLNGYQSSDTVTDEKVLEYLRIAPVWYMVLRVSECDSIPELDGTISFNKKELK